MDRKLVGPLFFLGGGGAGSPSNTMAYLYAKFRLDPSNRLATVHRRHRQTDRAYRQTDRQIYRQTDRQTDNGLIAYRRTVLQTVAQNRLMHKRHTTDNKKLKLQP